MLSTLLANWFILWQSWRFSENLEAVFDLFSIWELGAGCLSISSEECGEANMNKPWNILRTVPGTERTSHSLPLFWRWEATIKYCIFSQRVRNTMTAPMFLNIESWTCDRNMRIGGKDLPKKSWGEKWTILRMELEGDGGQMTLCSFLSTKVPCVAYFRWTLGWCWNWRNEFGHSPCHGQAGHEAVQTPAIPGLQLAFAI